MRLKNNKRAIEIGFNWLFAIIAGAFILFFALYASKNIIEVGEISHGTEMAASFASFVDALETGLASGKCYPINFTKEALIDYKCEIKSNPPFGQEKVSFNEKTFGNKYGIPGEYTPIKDKYIFVEDSTEGKGLFFCGLPFFLSFKVADVIIFLDENYCFYKTPEYIKNKIEGLEIWGKNYDNLILGSDDENFGSSFAFTKIKLAD